MSEWLRDKWDLAFILMLLAICVALPALAYILVSQT